MKNLFLSIILVFNFSCMKDTFIVNPRSIKEAKETNAFIKEFVGNNSNILIDNKEYLIEEVYLTYKIDSKNVYKQAVNLVFKLKNQSTKEINCPDDYTKFTIIANKEKYDFGNNSGYLVSSIPKKTSAFQLVYFDNQVKKIINFKEK
jgi:hypothetical protein